MSDISRLGGGERTIGGGCCLISVDWEGGYTIEEVVIWYQWIGRGGIVRWRRLLSGIGGLGGEGVYDGGGCCQVSVCGIEHGLARTRA